VSQCLCGVCNVKKISKTIIFETVGEELDSHALEQFVRSARRAAGLRGEVSLLITSDAGIRQLNLRFRGKNSVTDVLSFPAAESNGFAGDIAISFDIAARNARALGHSIADEIRILILHGILHLAGYDHENDRGEMEKKESALRNSLGLPTGLIERSVIHHKSSSVVRRATVPSTENSSKSRLQRITRNTRRSRT
jgi:probable rRNA maturation factor